MRLIRFRTDEGVSWGCLEGEDVYFLEDDPLVSARKGPRVGRIDDVRLFAPCNPEKVLALAVNYEGATGQKEGTKEPLVFLKSPNSVCGPADDIECAFADAEVWGEVELAVVIGKELSKADTDEAERGIFGYAIANDVTASNIDGRDHHLARSKAADTFCPIGPWIDTDFDPSNKVIDGYQNGVLIRKGNTDQRIWKDARIVSWLSSWITLKPWDVILTGTPPRVREKAYLKDGDVYRASVEGLGSIENSFRILRG